MSEIPERKPDTPYIFWNSDKDKHEAMEKTAGNIDSYDGILSANASHRSYLDIEPNISVRTEYMKDDYYRFRRSEQPADKAKGAMSMCMRAYDSVGIIKNVIDLMGDFGSQGITLYHPNKKVQKFYRKWWHKVNGLERSERFLNMLYRVGNVVVYKRYGKISKKMQTEMSRGEDVVIKPPKIIKKQIPLKYDFLNPATLDVVGGYNGFFMSQPVLKMQISQSLKKAFRENKDADMLIKIPDNIRKALEKGSEFVELEPERISTFFYKKDDWELWANPMINAIIDDVVMLEKMKLADMSALDGAISNIRLWRLGDLDHKILPNKAAIDKLRNILASNVGGGTMDLVWGPEIDYKESTTQVYKFLGTEKYQPVLNSIYAGLGIPPTLTGLAGQSGGFTNNFISLKTLIERLEYGRDLLRKFWIEEIEYIQRAMGFKNPAQIHFDNMILSDEAAEKNLLIQLADRDIISVETLRDRFGEISNIEDIRINNESKQRNKKMMPPKADPYHNANTDSEYKKIALQKGEIGVQDVTDLQPDPTPTVDEVERIEVERDAPTPNPEGGRPKFSLDQQKRKQKRVLPKSTPTLSTLMIWTTDAQDQISKILNPALLDHYGKKNLRELSKAQLAELEDMKFKALCKLEPHSDIDGEILIASLSDGTGVDEEFIDCKNSFYSDFIEKNQKNPSIDEMRQIYNMSYSFRFFS